MTLIVCKKQKGKLTCIADTRISNSGSTISDSGGKVFIIPVCLSKFDNDLLQEKFNFTLGFAFCGSTLLANNTHVIASNCSQLFRSDSVDAIPSAEFIANMYAKAAEFVIRDTNSRLTNPIYFQGLVFGYCHVKKKHCVFSIHSEVSKTSFSVKTKEIVMEVDTATAIGSGSDEFLRQMKIFNSAGNPREVLDVVSQIMAEDNVTDVGGHIQVIEATQDGVNVVPILTQSRENLDQATITVNGFDVDKFNLPEGLRIGSRAIGHGVESIAAREALKLKGIDPDGDSVTKELQNLASFEAMLVVCFKLSKKAVIDDNYTLDITKPIKGNWYFSGKCKKCNKNTPLFIDSSKGAMGNPFTGIGSITTCCFRCGTVIKKKATGLRSKKWNGT